MIRFVLLIILFVGLCDCISVNTAKYEKALKKKALLKKLFKQTFHHKKYSGIEIKKRLPYFKEALQFVVKQNTNPDIGWESDINLFADKTPDEREKMLMKVYDSGSKIELHDLPLGNNGRDTVDWTKEAYVGRVEDQTEDCRACWAFAAVAAIEGRYKVITNSSVDFSEQELIDCVYYIKGRTQDGCYGGNLGDVYDYVKDYGRLATEDASPYEHVDHKKCDYDDVKNGLKEAYIQSWKSLDYSDQTHIDALLDGPISAAVQTTESFLFYKSGNFKDDSCTTLIPNHAVAVVGYDPTSYRIKNSWGKNWGDSGYMSVARGHHGCGLIFYMSVPQLVAGVPDTKPLPGPPDECRDVWGADFCAPYLKYCQYYKQWCAKSCNVCKA